ncbi:hypothetical protein J6590_060476 [Homalodisca vitripennis]|nr:hypothetical protein J6590_060476 [Homalodisca vitripennis]
MSEERTSRVARGEWHAPAMIITEPTTHGRHSNRQLTASVCLAIEGLSQFDPNQAGRGGARCCIGTGESANWQAATRHRALLREPGEDSPTEPDNTDRLSRDVYLKHRLYTGLSSIPSHTVTYKRTGQVKLSRDVYLKHRLYTGLSSIPSYTVTYKRTGQVKLSRDVYLKHRLYTGLSSIPSYTVTYKRTGQVKLSRDVYLKHRLLYWSIEHPYSYGEDRPAEPDNTDRLSRDVYLKHRLYTGLSSIPTHTSPINVQARLSRDVYLKHRLYTGLSSIPTHTVTYKRTGQVKTGQLNLTNRQTATVCDVYLNIDYILVYRASLLIRSPIKYRPGEDSPETDNTDRLSRDVYLKHRLYTGLSSIPSHTVTYKRTGQVKTGQLNLTTPTDCEDRPAEPDNTDRLSRDVYLKHRLYTGLSSIPSHTVTYKRTGQTDNGRLPKAQAINWSIEHPYSYGEDRPAEPDNTDRLSRDDYLKHRLYTGLSSIPTHTVTYKRTGQLNLTTRQTVTIPTHTVTYKRTGQVKTGQLNLTTPTDCHVTPGEDRPAEPDNTDRLSRDVYLKHRLYTGLSSIPTHTVTYKRTGQVKSGQTDNGRLPKAQAINWSIEHPYSYESRLTDVTSWLQPRSYTGPSCIPSHTVRPSKPDNVSDSEVNRFPVAPGLSSLTCMGPPQKLFKHDLPEWVKCLWAINIT